MRRLQRSVIVPPETAGYDHFPFLEAGEYGVQPGIAYAFATVAATLIKPEHNYKEQLARVSKYFRREVRELVSLSGGPSSTVDNKYIEQCQSILITWTEQLEEMVSQMGQMGMSAPMTIFAVDVVCSVILGLLTSLTGDIWGILVLFLFGMTIMGDVLQLVTLTALGSKDHLITQADCIIELKKITTPPVASPQIVEN